MTFSLRAHDLALSIPPGRATSYSALAYAAGGTIMQARNLTNLLMKFPNQDAIPYHRIVYAAGRVFKPGDEPDRHIDLLRAEGVEVDGRGHIRNWSKVMYHFD